MGVQKGDRIQRPHGSSTCYPAEFNAFLKSRIHDIENLRESMAHANFIAMDTEHWDMHSFSSIGLAFAAKVEPNEHPIHPAAIAGVLVKGSSATHEPEERSRKNAVAQSVCFNIRGFARSRPTRERIWGQPDQNIEVEAVASKITEFVKRCKEAEPEKPLILVTYSSRAELSAISSLFPQLCDCISNWVDLQPLVMDAYHRHANYTRLDGLKISLRYATRTLGFSAGYQPANLHHAGNDALRTLAIMMCLTHENVECRRLKELEHVLRVNKYRKEQRRLKGTQKDQGLLGKRPGPPSRYPHVARITMVSTSDIEEREKDSDQSAVAEGEQENEGEGQLNLPTFDSYRPHQTWDFFSPYEADAIGRVCKEKCYYVCVSSQSILHQLVCDLDKTSACSGAHILLVEDVSDLRALGAAKREERAKRRQA